MTMIELIRNTYPWRATASGAIALLLSLAGMIFLLGGCAVDEVCLISYTSEAEVKAPENEPRLGGVVGSSPLPWDIVLSGASDILTGARKKAIEEKVGYHESRSFTLFRVKAAESSRDPCPKRPTPQDDRALGKDGK